MMAQVWVNVNVVDFERKIVLAKAYWLQTSPFKSEPYKHKYINDEGDEIDICYMRKPSDKLCEAYGGVKGGSNDYIFDNVVLRLQKDRQDKLKQIGQKFLPKREREAYELHLQGYSTKEGAEKMGIGERAFNKSLSSCKERMKSPEYTRETKGLEKIRINKEQTQDAHAY